MPLLPPSSRSERPSRAATVWATARPIGTRCRSPRSSGSRAIGGERLADVARRRSPGCDTPGGTNRQFASTLDRTSVWQAIAESGVFSDGFQTTVSPQTSASIAFQAQTATGKVERRDDADRAQRMPLLHQAVLRAARWRSSGRRAAGSGRRRSRRCRSSPALRRAPPARSCRLPRSTSVARSCLCSPQQLADAAHELPALRRGHRPPRQERLVRLTDDGRDLLRRRLRKGRQPRAVDRRTDRRAPPRGPSATRRRRPPLAARRSRPIASSASLELRQHRRSPYGSTLDLAVALRL